MTGVTTTTVTTTSPLRLRQELVSSQAGLGRPHRPRGTMHSLQNRAGHKRIATSQTLLPPEAMADHPSTEEMRDAPSPHTPLLPASRALIHLLDKSLSQKLYMTPSRHIKHRLELRYMVHRLFIYTPGEGRNREIAPLRESRPSTAACRPHPTKTLQVVGPSTEMAVGALNLVDGHHYLICKVAPKVLIGQ